MKTRMSDASSAAAAPAAQARPYPRNGSDTTLAPAAVASAAVSSVLPLSTTMHSRIKFHGISRTTDPMFSASFNAGMTTETPWTKSEAPAQTTAGTGGGRVRAEQGAAKVLVLFAVPNLAHGLLGCVAESKAVIAAHGEWCYAAGQGLAVSGDVHQAPGPAAEGPGAVILALLDADLRLRRAGGTEVHAQFLRHSLGSLYHLFFLLGGVLKQGRLRPRQSLPLGQVHHSLQVNLHDAQAMRQANEGLQLREGFAQTGEPERNPW